MFAQRNWNILNDWESYLSALVEKGEQEEQWVDWNVCAEDAVGGHPSADTIYRNVVRETGEQTHCVVLMHDSATTRTTAEALPDIIRWYTDNGYTFLTVAEALPLG